MEWTAIIWAALSGLVAGAVLGGVEWVTRKRFPNLHSSMRVSLAAAACLIVFLPLREYSGRYNVLEFLCPLLPDRAAFQLRIERHGARLMSVPEIDRALRSAPSKAAALQISRQLTAQGVRRLDDATLLRRAVLFSGMLADVDEAQCAALARGTATQETLLWALKDRAALDAWFDMTFRAAVAEVEQRPTSDLSEPEIEQAVAALRRELPKNQVDRVLDAIAQPAELPDRDLCWAARTLYQTATAMRDPERAVLIRALTQ
jgi:hypothetical protein